MKSFLEVLFISSLVLVVLLVSIFIFHAGRTSFFSKRYTLTYVVFYPNKPDTITVSNSFGYTWMSVRGSNKIIGGSEGNVYEGTAPFKIIQYKETSK